MKTINTTQKTATSLANWAYVVGRFQLPHVGHFALFKEALNRAEKVLVFIGSANASRNASNPFTEQEREQMLRLGLTAQEQARIQFIPIEDFYCNDRWVQELHDLAAQYRADGETAIVVGKLKDFSSQYLKKLGLTLVEVHDTVQVDATALRDIYFTQDNEGAYAVLANYTVPAVVDYLRAYAKTPPYAWLKRDYCATMQYRKDYPAAVHVTGDALVKCKDHILVIRRGGEIGNGQLALPGGFLEPNETVEEAPIRELVEETRIAVVSSLFPVYKKAEAVFSAPKRSSRGRIITHAFLYDLGNCEKPDVQPASDAKEAHWVKIEDLKHLRREFFEDHFHIIESMLAKIKVSVR